MEKKERRWEITIIIFIIILVAILILVHASRRTEKERNLQARAIINQGANFFPEDDYLFKDPTVIVEADTGGINSIMVRIMDPCAIKNLLYHRFFFPEEILEIGRPGDIYLDPNGEWIYEGQLIGPAN